MNTKLKSLLLTTVALTVTVPIVSNALAFALPPPPTAKSTVYNYVDPNVIASAAYIKTYINDVAANKTNAQAKQDANKASMTAITNAVTYNASHNLTSKNLFSSSTESNTTLPPLPDKTIVYTYVDPNVVANTTYIKTYNDDITLKESAALAKTNAKAAATLANTNAINYNTIHNLTTKNLTSSYTAPIKGTGVTVTFNNDTFAELNGGDKPNLAFTKTDTLKVYVELNKDNYIQAAAYLKANYPGAVLTHNVVPVVNNSDFAVQVNSLGIIVGYITYDTSTAIGKSYNGVDFSNSLGLKIVTNVPLGAPSLGSIYKATDFSIFPNVLEDAVINGIGNGYRIN